MTKSGFSVITVTNRIYCIKNLINNFLRQEFLDKELIIVINNNSISLSEFDNYVSCNKNIYLYKVDENISLGECLNYAVNNSNYDLIAKFDDDDYYGLHYLDESYMVFSKNDCDIVGKNITYYYIERDKCLIRKDSGIQNGSTLFVMGATLCFRKDIMQTITFRDLSSREDFFFSKDCINAGYKIFSSSEYNFIVFKHKDTTRHTFISNIDLLKLKCSTICTDLEFIDCFSVVDNRLLD